MIPVKDLETAFDAFFFSIGFQRIPDIIGESPSFKNADYINANKKVIIELKIIDKDFFSYGGVIDKLCAIVPIRQDPNTSIPPNSPGLYYLTIPLPNREGRHDTFEEPFRRILKKANRQIKETNHQMLQGEGMGIVMIALNMDTMIDLQVIYALTANLLSVEFSSIPGFLICDPRLAHSGAELSCLHGVKNNTTEIFQKLCDELGDYWCEFFYKIGNSGN